MPKLFCGLTRKAVDRDDGSYEASVSLEVDIEGATLRDPAKLKQHIRCGFDRIREAIAEELLRYGPATGTPVAKSGAARNGAGRRIRPVTASQLNLLRTLASRGDIELSQLVRDRCGRDDATALSAAEANRLIGELNGGIASKTPR